MRSHAEQLERIEKTDFWSKTKINLIMGLVEGKTVLDVGCGSGLLSQTLKAEGFNVLAIDDDSKAVEIARKKGVNAFQARVHDLNGTKIDCVICADVLEHIENDTETIRKIHSMLNPNGSLIINAPSYPSLYGKHDTTLGHKRRYTDKELKRKLENAGFKITSYRHWNLTTLPITILTKLTNKDYPHQKLSKNTLTSKTLETLLLMETKLNHTIGISILLKAKKQ